MTVFFTADTHFGHAGARALYRRPFPDVAAMDAAAEGRFSYWDALLLATAAEAGCAAAISEDMAEGAALGSIRVVTAFAADGGVNPAARALL